MSQDYQDDQDDQVDEDGSLKLLIMTFSTKYKNAPLTKKNTYGFLKEDDPLS